MRTWLQKSLNSFLSSGPSFPVRLWYSSLSLVYRLYSSLSQGFLKSTLVPEAFAALLPGHLVCRIRSPWLCHYGKASSHSAAHCETRQYYGICSCCGEHFRQLLSTRKVLQVLSAIVYNRVSEYILHPLSQRVHCSGNLDWRHTLTDM